mmetsp:Transcript_6757/g.18886  ORF Transcript_6757/g.18886 Transcript_6757/m.18886 type:complete len:263 (-) Transcript_6757:802-1590(-)
MKWISEQGGIVMVPSTSGHMPLMIRNKLDLPHPFGPVTSTRCPRSTCKHKSRKRIVPSGFITVTCSNFNRSPRLKVGGCGPAFAFSTSRPSTSELLSRAVIKFSKRSANPPSSEARSDSSNKSWIADAIDSMLRHVDEKYSAIRSLVYGKGPVRLRSTWSGRATKIRPMTVTKYLLRYCRKISHLSDISTVCQQWPNNLSRALSKQRCSGPFPRKNAICSQWVMRAECLQRNWPSNLCSVAASSPKGGTAVDDNNDTTTNQA